MQKGVVRKRRPGKPSEYGLQLQAKQELKREYGLRELQFKNGVKKILNEKNRKEDASLLLVRNLERRLDNAVFRIGLAKTREQGRQIVGHGHIVVNGKGLNIPSHLVKKGDIISLAPLAAKKGLFKDIKDTISKYQPPSWITLDKEKVEGTIAELPTLEHIQITVDIPIVFEFYSR